MKNTQLTAIFAALLLMLLPMILSSCKDAQEPSLPPSSSQAEPTQAPTASPAATEKPTPTAAPTPSPTPEATPEAGPAGEFDQLFQDNAIDETLNEELELADSSKAILRAYSDAGKFWKRMIQITYKNCQNLLSGDQLDSLQSQEEEWEAGLEEKKAGIAAEYGDDINDQIELSSKIVDLYREQGKVVCQAYYQATGEMPDFSVILTEEPLG